MRRIGVIEDAGDAGRFANYLSSLKIENEIREDEGEHIVYVIEEDDMERAERELRDFAANSSDRKYNVRPPVEAKRPDRHRQIDARTEVFNQPSGNQVPLTLGLIGLSILATYASDPIKAALMFSNFDMNRSMPEIANGQIWRLITPIFLHGNFIHLLFNMLWLFQLGGAIEANEGKRVYIPFVLVTAICVHLAQYYMSGPRFVGFSGVVYAMLGYVWMMARYKPSAGYILAQQVVVIMMVWLVVCLTGLMGPVANTQHVVGMLSGTLIGFLRSGGIHAIRRKREFKKKIDE